MRVQHQRRFVALLGVALVAGVWSAWPLSAQVRAKRPLTYDVYESWKSIGGARLSDDGQWFAYALTSQAEDGVLVVRNVRSGQELKHPRGSGRHVRHADRRRCTDGIAVDRRSGVG